MSRYVALLETEWEFFTEQHKKIWHGSEDVIGLESVLRGFITGNKPNPIAIRGAIGQGKTQLLYKIFKFVWENGGISFYTTLDMLIPESVVIEKTFKHSGSLGDIISGLPTIIRLGGGKLFIANDPLTSPHNRELQILVFSEIVPMLKPLLESQSYIKSVEVWDNQPVNYDMDSWRYKGLDLAVGNSAKNQLKNYNLIYDLTQKWLDVPPIHKKDIIINRTQRYNNPKFDWDKVLALFPEEKILFLGRKDEYAAFNRKEIEFYQVKNFLELASIIAGSELFIGNQSFYWWLAEAMKINRWLEAFPGGLNSMPQTENGKYFIDEEYQTIWT